MAKGGDEIASQKKKSLTGLARRLGRLSGEKKKVSLEMSASLAAVSLKVSREFVEAVPKAAKILAADDLRSWAEMGRKIAMANADLGVEYFAKGVSELRQIPAKGRSLMFQICTRQLLISSAIALETFELIPKLSKEINDKELFNGVLQLAEEIAARSAKHSADFLSVTSEVAKSFEKFGKDKRKVSKSTLKLASHFARRTGGMTADLWSSLPKGV